MSYLIYINGLGPNYKGDNMYEFIFSDSLDVDGEEWDAQPANGYPKPPQIEFIKKVGVLKDSDIKLSLIQDSDFFGMKDAMDGVICLGWEIESDDIRVLNTRLVFKFGELEQEVKDKLYERDVVLEFEKKVVYEN
jgi:hypothetical protein